MKGALIMCNCLCSKIELDGKEFCKTKLAIRLLDHCNGCYNLDVINKITGEVVKPLMVLYNIGCALKMAIEKTNELGLLHENFQFQTTEKARVVYA